MKHCFLSEPPTPFTEDFTRAVAAEDGVFVGMFSDFSDTDL